MSSAVNLCKRFEPRSGPTKIWGWPGFKLFDTLMVFLKEFFEKVLNKISRRQKRMQNYPECKDLTLKAPPIICSRRQFLILPLFQKQQIRHDISWKSSAGRRFSWNIIPYFCQKLGNFVAKFVVCCSCDGALKANSMWRASDDRISDSNTKVMESVGCDY